ncbi:MAG: RsmE family RNA methyltransferase [Deltaproteobacteria bacterium]|nr:RsmE family RNA methyltransferase [Deltaproteobacteria bacterium]
MHNRFYIEEEVSPYFFGKEIALNSITSHIKAFRKKADDEIKLYDGSGNVYSAKVISISKKSTKVKLISKETFPERNAKITLFLPLITSHLMDQLLSRLCEMEISRIFPVITERSINLKDEKEICHKLSKWDKISSGACVLTGKSFSTIINKPVSLKDSFGLAANFGIKLIASPSAKKCLRDYLMSAPDVFPSKNFSIGLFIGPEGDFSDRELKLSEEFDIIPVKLSNYIMSTFVASIYFVSNITLFACTG